MRGTLLRMALGVALFGGALVLPANAQEPEAASPTAQTGGEGDGYLYLREAPVSTLPYKRRSDESGQDAVARKNPPRLTFTPRVGIADPLGRSLSLSGQLRPLSGFTPRYRQSEISIEILPPRGRPEHALGVRLSSEYVLQDGGVFGFNGLGSPLDQRGYQFGLAFEMSGFSLGATLQHQEGGLFGERSEGLDVGLGYRIGDFETQLAVGEFTSSNRSNDLVFDRNFYRLELGAAYRVTERIRLSGGIRLFDYVGSRLRSADLANRAGMLYLGTQFSF